MSYIAQGKRKQREDTEKCEHRIIQCNRDPKLYIFNICL